MKCLSRLCIEQNGDLTILFALKDFFCKVTDKSLK